MNIVFTSDFSGIGGGETAIINLIDYYRKDNKIVVICDKEGTLVNRLRHKGIKVFVVNYMNKRRVMVSLLRLRHILKKEKIEVVHSNGHLTSILLYIAGIGLRIENFWTCHGQWYRFGKVLSKSLSVCNREIFCVTKVVENNLNRMGIYNTNVFHLGIPSPKYHNASGNDIRKEINITDDVFLIAIIARYQIVKGQLKGVQAIERLLHDGYNLCLILVGGNVFDSEADQAYENKVKSYIVEHKLNKRVFMIGERKDIPQILKSIDLLMIPSDNESFGMVAAEALAAETPIISTPNDGVSEVLKWNNLMLSKTNDAGGLYEAIKDYMDNDGIKKAIEDFLRENWNQYDISAVAQQYMKVFKKYAYKNI